MIRTLQRKFIFSAMLAITVLLVSLLGSLNVINAMLNVREADMLLDMLVTIESSPVPQMARPPMDRNTSGDRKPPVNENKRMSAVYFVTRTDGSGSVVYADVSRIANITEEQATVMTKAAVQNKKTEGRMSAFRYRSVLDSQEKETVWVFLNTTEQLQSIFRLIAVSCIIGTVCWLIMFFFVLLLSRRAIRPIAAGIERQKQFVADAGHEIKTPLAIILANTEAMELHAGENKWSRNIREQVTRLGDLMQNLLMLSKIDEGNIAVTKENISISDLITEGTVMFREAMELKQITSVCRIQSDLTVHANKELLERLISILLDNVVKYTPRNGKVVIELFRNDKGTQLIVANECEKLPNCPPEKLFDRFYRADQARTQKNGGYGIGLSAAQSIVEAHGGSIGAVYQDEHTVVFFVSL